MGDALADALATALTAAATDAPALTDALGMTGFVRAGDAAWDDVRALGIAPGQAGLALGDEVTCPFD